MEMEKFQAKYISKNKNVYEKIKSINQEYKRADILNTSIAYLLTFKELKKIKAKTDTTLLTVAKFTGVCYARLREISALFKASQIVLDKVELFNKTRGKEGVSASVVCRILKRKGILPSKVIEKAVKEKWNTSNADNYFVQLREERNDNGKEFLSHKEKSDILGTVDKKISVDKRIKDNKRLIDISMILRRRLDDMNDNRGISFVSLVDELVSLENGVHEFLIRMNDNCYRCKNCNLTFFTQVKGKKEKCTACSSNQIEKVRLDEENKK